MAGKSHKQAKIHVAVIGLGAVGSALAQGLAATGAVRLTLLGEGEAVDRRLARKTGADLARYPQDLPQDIDIIILSIHEPDMRRLSLRLTKLSLPWPRVAVLHTSGPTSAEILNSLAKLGAGIAAWHPYQTFPRRGRMATLRGITYGVSGNRKGITAARRLSQLLGGQAVVLRDEDRLLYHASAVLACGFVAADLQAAEAVLKTIGFSTRQARAAVVAIAGETLKNIRELGVEAAQTGPAVRGDVATVRKHRKALVERAPEVAEVYARVSEYVLNTRSKRR